MSEDALNNLGKPETGESAEPKKGPYSFEELTLGMHGVTENIIEPDTLPRFNSIVNSGTLAPNALCWGFISAAFGVELPGHGAIYLQQFSEFIPEEIKFMPGDTVRVEVEILELIPEKRQVVFNTTCKLNQRIVMTGKAKLMVPVTPEVTK